MDLINKDKNSKAFYSKKMNTEPDRESDTEESSTPRLTYIAKFCHHEFKLASGTIGFENKQGILLKQSKLSKKPKSYFATVQDDTFTLQDEKEQNKRFLTINFSQIKCKVLMKDFIIQLIIEDSPYAFYLSHQSQSEIKEWFMALTFHAKRNQNCQSQGSILNRPKFWKTHFISREYFETVAESLDILIFQSIHFGAQVQRAITNSEFDHVVMVLKTVDGSLCIFEANSEDGVGIWSWKQFPSDQFKKFFARVVYRKVIMKRNEQIINGLQDFVRKSMGKKYQLTLSKLLKKKSIFTQNQMNEERTFFCSELIAAALKSIDLLPKDLSSTQYWPKDFSASRSLQLLQNAQFSHEMELNFDL